MGEPAGVGPELTCMAWHQRKILSLPPFAYIGDIHDLRTRIQLAGIEVPLQETTIDQSCEHFDSALPVLHQPLAVPSQPGIPDSRNGKSVIQAIEQAVALVTKGKARAIVTNPIQKHSLIDVQFPFLGHTEYLGVLAKKYFPDNPPTTNLRPVMMLVSPDLRVVPVTVHIPLRKVPETLTSALIVETAWITLRDLHQHFQIPSPRIGICGLNPHAGEQGELGLEETQLIAPAIEQLRNAGHKVDGPLPADSSFHQNIRRKYDAILAMYHDQALIPIKTLAFEQAVNVTLGLPFIRTSPDHGTALDIAGTGTACPKSLITALHTAASLTPLGRKI